jgi:membrane carboxypeptidase/penicillin-binding protein
MRKFTVRFLLSLFGLVVAYLLLVSFWARAAVDDILVQHPVAAIPVRLSPGQAAMLLAVEDPTFYTHAGVSLANGQGATTITSSLARDVFLFRSELTGVKGALQAVLRAVFDCCKRIDIGRDAMAVTLDGHMTKERQLALFVDQVYMGRHNGVQLRGLAPASEALLGTPLAQLDARQFTALIGMIKSPNDLHPHTRAAAHRLRSLRVHAVATGACQPSGWFDTDYAAC